MRGREARGRLSPQFGLRFRNALRGRAGPIEHDAAESLQLSAVAEIEQFVIVAACAGM